MRHHLSTKLGNFCLINKKKQGYFWTASKRVRILHTQTLHRGKMTGANPIIPDPHLKSLYT